MGDFVRLLVLATSIVILTIALFVGILYAVVELFTIAIFSPENFLIALVITVGLLSSLVIVLAVLRKMWDRY